jgi:outer membrane protein assembly factor BamB
MRDLSRENLGTADPSTTIARSHRVDETEYVVTRSVSPTLLGAVDLDARRVVEHHEFPSGGGAWGIADLDGDLYVGMYPHADLYRFDVAGGELRRVARFADDTYTTDVAVADGTVYAGTYPTASVYAYDPESEEVEAFGEAIDEEDYVRNLLADGDDIYAGIGSHAHLIHLDRASGARTDILPSDLRDDSWAWVRDLTDDFVLVQTDPSGTILVLDREDHSEVGRVAPPDGVGDCSTVVDGTAYFLAGGFLRGYDLASDSVRELAPVPGEGLESAPVVDDDDVFFLAGDTLCRYDPGGGSLSTLATLPEWAVEIRGANLSPGYFSAGLTDDLWVYDRASGESTVIELRNAGLPPCAEESQSLALLDGTPVVAGHGKVHVHDDERHRFHVPGEPKVMTAIGDTLYMGIYGGAKIASYTRQRGAARIEATIGEEQNRPRAIHHHEPSEQLLVGTKADYGKLGGAISGYDPETGALETYRNVIDDQTIHAITSIGDTAYLGSEIYGGLGVDPAAEEAALAAWDPETGEVPFELTPVPGAEVVNTLVATGGSLYGATASGTLFVVDPDAESVVHTEEIASHVGQLVVHGDAIYGVTADRLIEVDPDTYGVETVLDGLDPHWFNWPMLAIDDAGRAYFLEEYDLVRAAL